MSFCLPSCCQNILPKTVVIIVSTVLVLTGLVSTSLGIYTKVKHQNDSFMEAYMVDPFDTDEAITYIGELRLGSRAQNLDEKFDNWKNKFDNLVRSTVVKNAWAPRKDGSDNIELSHFLEGFRDAALCKTDCSRDGRETSEILGSYMNKQLAGVHAVGDALDSGAKLSAKAANAVDDVKDKVEEVKDKMEGDDKKDSGDNDEAESTTTRRMYEVLKDIRRAEAEEEAQADAAEKLKTFAASEGADLANIVANGEMKDEDYNAGYDLAYVIKDFQINWIVLLVFGLIMLVLGGMTCKALVNRWIALTLAICCWLLGIFMFLQYGQGAGWEFADKLLTNANMGGVMLDASDELRKNHTAELAIDSLLAFYKPWYMLVAALILMTLGSMFSKLACCSNMKVENKMLSV